MLAVVLTGPPGVGKTTVLTALADALTGDDVAHAAVDVEALSWAHPPPPADARLDRLAALCASYRAAGHRLLLAAETVESDAELTALLAAIAPDESFVVRLVAGPDTLRARILAREPAFWQGAARLAEHAQDLARRAVDLRGADLTISTDSERPDAARDVARASS